MAYDSIASCAFDKLPPPKVLKLSHFLIKMIGLLSLAEIVVSNNVRLISDC